MTSGQFVYIWRYTIHRELESEFLAAYGPGGDWVRLFSQDPAYLRTTLLKDINTENAYVTIDYWRTRHDRDAFRQRFAAEFESLDNRCEQFTIEEVFLGDYSEIDKQQI